MPTKLRIEILEHRFLLAIDFDLLADANLLSGRLMREPSETVRLGDSIAITADKSVWISPDAADQSVEQLYGLPAHLSFVQQFPFGDNKVLPQPPAQWGVGREQR